MEEEIVRLKAEFPDAFSDIPGRADFSPMPVEVEPGTRPNQAHPCRILDCLKQDVKDELFRLYLRDMLSLVRAHGLFQ